MRRASAVVASAVLFSAVVSAAPILSIGSTPLTTVDFMATFDTLTAYNVANLATYSEGGIDVRTPSSWPNFPSCGGVSPCWYANSGYPGGVPASLANISLTAGGLMQVVDFLGYSGGGYPRTFYWETYRGGIQTGSGNTTLATQGTLFAVSDAAGFDLLRVGVIFSNDANVIGIDDLRVERASTVPEPTTITLFGSALLFGVVLRRRRSQR
ncbi:MAG: PEP-CTERM sorting domain-containing protein [Bryobacterales bacterium]|nr:PEP-CTERM sorting domain-containing protein [Bryobacterales bacterium]